LEDSVEVNFFLIKRPLEATGYHQYGRTREEAQALVTGILAAYRSLSVPYETVVLWIAINLPEAFDPERLPPSFREDILNARRGLMN
jgi:hypothetical protein